MSALARPLGSPPSSLSLHIYISYDCSSQRSIPFSTWSAGRFFPVINFSMFQVGVSRFSAFSPFSGSRNCSLPNNFELLSCSFDDALIRRLKALNPPSLTLSWLSLAVDFLSTIHAEVRSLISNLKPSASDDSLACFLDDSVKLLDVCNSISSEIERLRQRRLLINFVIHLLDFSGEGPAPEKLKKARDSLADWANCPRGFTKRRFENDVKVLIHDLARGLGNAPRGKISSVERLVRRTVYTVGAMTVFFAGVVVFSLYGLPDLVAIQIPAEFAWADSFAELQTTISEKIKGSKIGELNGVETRIRTVCDAVDDVARGDPEKDKKERLKDAVKELATAAKTFSEGLDGLHNGVNGMFHTVLGARNDMLDSYRVGGNGGKPKKQQPK